MRRHGASAAGSCAWCSPRSSRWVARDPTLIAKALLQLLYLVPLLVITLQRNQPQGILAAALVVLAAGLAGTLAWITVSGEEAPDLLGAAPLSLERVRWLKVAAALVPVAVLVAPFLAWYAHIALGFAATVAIFVAAALASSAVVQLWATPLGGGRDLHKRRSQNPFVHLADTLSSFGWGLACYLALARSPWLVAGVVLGLFAPVVAWLGARRGR
jgi:ABC-2 type transport system permease protein